MKLRNKKTGQIVELDHFSMHYSYHYDYGEDARGEQPCSTWNTSLAELNEEWEDYEEPKHSYYLTGWGEVKEYPEVGFNINHKLEIGNYFATREEAEKAVEKLKAWKRLKEANIDYKLSREYDDFTETMHANVAFSFNSYPLVGKDLDLLFSGEDD